jgi:hypothetical protein
VAIVIPLSYGRAAMPRRPHHGTRSALVALVALVALAGCDDATGGTSTNDLKQRPASNVELKVTLREDEIERALEDLELYDEDAEGRAVFFYDTMDLDLYGAGVVLRARDSDGGDDEATAKIRPMKATSVDLKWFAISGFKCEIDRVGTKDVESCSLTRPEKGKNIDDVFDGDDSVKSLFSKDQEKFLSTYASSFDWDDLEVLGPVDVAVWKLDDASLPEELTVERWTLPDDTAILEVSMRVSASKAKDGAKKLAAFLDDYDLDASDTQETKTQAALDYFTGQ